jgi:acylphosphatase
MKLKIVITGSDVHGVGYRVFLLKHAMNLAVAGLSVYNWEVDGQQQVIALAESDEGRIIAFRKVAEEKRPPLAKVSDVTFEPYDGDVGRTSELAMLCSFVQLDKAIPLLLRMDDKLGSMDDKLGSMDDKLDLVVESQRDTVDEIRDLREDLVGSREWQLRVERDIKVIKSKLGIR